MVRAQTLSLRRRDFISASIIAGERTWRVVLVELTPHLASLLLSTFIGTTIYAIGAQVGLESLRTRRCQRGDVGDEPLLGEQ